MRRLLFTIPSYAYLEPSFLSAGEFDRGEIERKTFPDGERYLRILASLHGREVVLLGGTASDADWLDVFDLVRMAPARVPGEPGWIAVSAGRFHTCAMRADGSVWCTGANDVGMLGNDMTERVASFTRVLFP